MYEKRHTDKGQRKETEKGQREETERDRERGRTTDVPIHATDNDMYATCQCGLVERAPPFALYGDD